MSKLNLFFRLSKVDEAQRLVYGIATAEIADKTGEICDYATTVPYYKAWSAEIQKASGGKSLGNVREMHDNKAVGKLTQINFDDDKKQIEVCAKIVEESTWQKVVEGVLLGFSQGGSYVKTWQDGEHTRYTADPSEISVVDNPCLGAATFEYIKADGTKEIRKAIGAAVADDLKQVWRAKDGSTHDTKAMAKKHNDALVAAVDVPAGVRLAQDILKQLDTDDVVDPPVETPAKKTAKPHLKKGMQEIARAACLIQELDWLHSAIEWEQEMEHDDSVNPAHLMEIIKELGEFLCNLCEEETREMAGEDDEDEIMEMAAGWSDREIESLLKFLPNLKKAGARHSKTDSAHLTEMHGHLDKMGKHVEKLHALHKGMAETHAKQPNEGDHKDAHAAMGDHLDKLHKVAGKLDKCHGGMEECMKGLGAMDGEEGAEKMATLTTANEALNKTVSEMTAALEAIQKRLTTVEKSPAPSKVAVMVTKGDEHQTGKDARESSPQTVPSVISPEMWRARQPM